MKAKPREPWGSRSRPAEPPRYARLVLGAALGLAVSACNLTNDSASDRRRAGDRPPPALAWSAGLPLLPEDKPRSIVYRQATLRWRTATVAFSRGDYAKSAEAFFAVADVLKTSRPHPHASTFATARCLAYENAARALAETRDLEAAARRLETAVDDDPACPKTVQRAFKALAR